MKILSAIVLASALFTTQALAEEATASSEPKEFTIIIKDHKFTPESLEVPAGEQVKLVIDNQDSTPEEFESHSMNSEKIIKGNSQGVVLVGPLAAGEYEYFGEFNADSAKGKIVAK